MTRVGRIIDIRSDIYGEIYLPDVDRNVECCVSIVTLRPSFTVASIAARIHADTVSGEIDARAAAGIFVDCILKHGRNVGQ